MSHSLTLVLVHKRERENGFWEAASCLSKLMRSIHTGNATQHSLIHSLNYSITCWLVNSINIEYLVAGDLKMNRALFSPSECSLRDKGNSLGEVS